MMVVRKPAGQILGVLCAIAAPFAAVSLDESLRALTRLSDVSAYAILVAVLVAGAVALWLVVSKWHIRLLVSLAYLPAAAVVAFCYALDIACRVHHECP